MALQVIMFQRQLLAGENAFASVVNLSLCKVMSMALARFLSLMTIFDSEFNPTLLSKQNYQVESAEDGKTASLCLRS